MADFLRATARVIANLNLQSCVTKYLNSNNNFQSGAKYGMLLA
jgi:hypothetical protein